MASSWNVPFIIAPISLKGNLAQDSTFVLTASMLDAEKDEGKIALLVHNLGDKCINIFNLFNLTTPDSQNYELVIGLFETYIIPKPQLTIVRQK